MSNSSRSESYSRADESALVDDTVLNGEACVKCGFRCIQGCV